MALFSLIASLIALVGVLLTIWNTRRLDAANRAERQRDREADRAERDRLRREDVEERRKIRAAEDESRELERLENAVENSIARATSPDSSAQRVGMFELQAYVASGELPLALRERVRGVCVLLLADYEMRVSNQRAEEISPYLERQRLEPGLQEDPS